MFVQGVRTKTVKKSARAIIEKYYSRLTMDFHTNKRVCDEVAIIPSKRMRNKIAGFVTHLMKRIQRGPVRGISLKLQEEERERRMDFVPEVCWLSTRTCCARAGCGESDRVTIDKCEVSYDVLGTPRKLVFMKIWDCFYTKVVCRPRKSRRA